MKNYQKLLNNKTIVVGVTGGIAAYKTVSLVSKLTQAGANVHVMMTPNATNFVTPLTFRTISNNPVTVETFENPNTWNVNHVSLSEKADLFVVAPCSANVIGKLASGIADDFLTSTLLAAKSKIFIYPAMNCNMYENPITQRNICTLKTFGFEVFDTEEGYLACGDVGKGRLKNVDLIFEDICEFFNKKKLDFLKNKNVLITSGPTLEKIDPVRYISNFSSGKMGKAFADVALDSAANVTVVSGPVKCIYNSDINLINVESADEMFSAVKANYDAADIAIFVAAVADYKTESFETNKIKKKDNFSISFVKNPDIALELGKAKTTNKIHIGCCAETQNIEEFAKKKLIEKNFNIIMANNVLEDGAGFGVDTNIVTLFDNKGRSKKLDKMSKTDVAYEVYKFLNEYIDLEEM